MQTKFHKEIVSFVDRKDIEWKKRSSPVPDVLYHYTDAAGLIGILDSKRIRLTHANYLNDSSELKHGWKIAFELLKKKIDQHKEDKKVKSFLEFLINKRSALEQEVEVFVASFCRKDDLLNQWRGYGSSDGAFSIGIDIEGSPIRNQIYKVEYNEIEQKKYIDNFLDELLLLIKKHDIDNSSSKIDDFTLALACFCSQISSDLIYFKNNAFANEQEWRLHEEFFNDDLEALQNTQFREASGVIVPYRECSLNSETTSKTPVLSITYALAKDNSLTKKSIELLLLKHEYDPSNIEITASKVPLRFK